MIEGEKSFVSEKTVNYLMEEANWDCPYLLIIFSAFSKQQDKIKHPYNYRKTLSNVNLHKLFIQDTCGPRGCYYLCEQLDQIIMNQIASKHVTDSKNTKVYLLLSENGELYLTDFVPLQQQLVKYHFPHEIVNEKRMKDHGEAGLYFIPYLQRNIPSIIRGEHLKLPQLIFQDGQTILHDAKGYILKEYNVEGLVKEEKIISDSQPIYIKDNKLVLEILYQDNIIYSYIIYDGIIMNDKLQCREYSIIKKNSFIEFNLEIESESEIQVAFYLLANNRKVAYQWYSTESKYVVEVKKGEEYVIQYFIKYDQGQSIIRQTQKIRI